jgi:hypothetical protein
VVPSSLICMGRGDARGPGFDADPGLPAPTDSAEVAVALAGEALSGLLAARLWARSDAQVRDLVVAAADLVGLAQAVYLAAVRELDSRPEAVPGARAGQVARTFLVHRLRVGKGQAKRDVTAAQATDPDDGPLPGLGAALASGSASREHVDVAVRMLAKVPQHLLTQVGPDGHTGAQAIDQLTTEHAARFCPDTTRGLARHMLRALDPHGTDRYDPHAYTRRDLTCTTDSTGMLVGAFQLDPAAGAVVKTALDTFGHPAPTTTARTPDGQQVLIGDDRSPGQRRADALLTICTKALRDTTDDDNETSTPAPLTHVTILATPEQVLTARHPDPEPPQSQAPVTFTAEAPETLEEEGTEPPEAEGMEAPATETAHENTGERTGAGESTGAGAGENTGEGAGESTGAGAGESTGAGAGENTGEGEGGGERGAGGRAPAAGCSSVTDPGLAECLQTGPLNPGSLARLACDAVLQAVFTTSSKAVLNLGRAVRTVSTAQRKALLARDHGCVIPGCAAPVAACQAHHITFWRNGGGTDLANLVMLCNSHHTAVHAGIWSLTVLDGIPWVIPPDWVDPEQRPLRNQITDARQEVRRVGQQLRLWHDPPRPPGR